MPPRVYNKVPTRMFFNVYAAARILIHLPTSVRYIVLREATVTRILFYLLGLTINSISCEDLTVIVSLKSSIHIENAVLPLEHCVDPLYVVGW